ncbi:MAG: c-type cytochrome [Schleiferiaceae bacterium]|nr:MAG: Uncharacterised protein [Cryomorphaceae bacterium]
MKRITTVIALSASAFLASCNADKTSPGYTYMDDMYRSPSFETYEPSAQFANGLSAQLPVEGTVPRGYHPYEFANTNEGYEAARTTLEMPTEFASEEMLKEGKELYNIFCDHCHGEKGDGNGPLVMQEKILGVPSYAASRLPDITPGSMYHVLMHGKGIMGSHASQLHYDERWKIVRYVVKLREDQE